MGILERRFELHAHGTTVRTEVLAGATYRLLQSPDFVNWTPRSTNTAASSGLFEFIDSPPFPLLRGFRVVRP